MTTGITNTGEQERERERGGEGKREEMRGREETRVGRERKKRERERDFRVRAGFFVLELDARYEWQVTPPNTHCTLFPISHFGHTVYLNTQLENFRAYVDVQHI